MSDTPPDFDLKFLPDWLKETPDKNPYANFEGEREERPRRDFSSKRSGPPPARRDDRRKSESRPPQRDGPRRDTRPGQDRNRPPHAAAPAAPPRPATVNVEFVPNPEFAAALAKQIKSSSRAYPLFDVARMFLDKPDRHRVKISAVDPSATLFQCGENGPLSSDRQTIEKNAFALSKHLYYAEQTTQGEPPKGNFTNVARCRESGVLLGPTNHHAYQTNLRKLYEERFSRRISFPEFQRQIETISAPEAIEAWKEQVRSVTTFTTTQEAEPLTFNSASEAEQHFRKHYLAQILRSGNAFEISGEASRNLPDRAIASAVRETWETETRFPGHVMNHLRGEFVRAGLFVFKHRNRVQLISAIRPTPFAQSQQSLSEGITSILKTIAAATKCTRAELAAKLLPPNEEEAAKIKPALASDLRWLIDTGHVIEMHNGILELPYVPAPETKPVNKPSAAPAEKSARPVEQQPKPQQPDDVKQQQSQQQA
jgi:hypothetical protein